MNDRIFSSVLFFGISLRLRQKNKSLEWKLLPSSTLIDCIRGDAPLLNANANIWSYSIECTWIMLTIFLSFFFLSFFLSFFLFSFHFFFFVKISESYLRTFWNKCLSFVFRLTSQILITDYRPIWRQQLSGNFYL